MYWTMYWFMFPVSVAVATTAMTFGIGGAVFFSPIFVVAFPLLGVQTLTPAEAFGAALLTEVAGFASGLFGYVMKKMIDYKSAAMLLAMGMPMAVMGSMLKHRVPKDILVFAFAGALALLTAYVWYHRVANARKLPVDTPVPTDGQKMLLHASSDDTRRSSVGHGDGAGGDDGESGMARGPRIPSLEVEAGEASKLFSRDLKTADGERFVYKVCRPVMGMILVAVGSFLTGMLSAGVGETSVSVLHGQCHIPMRMAAGTSVLVTFGVVAAASITNIIVAGVKAVPWNLIVWTVPGVLIGGQIGVRTSKYVSGPKAEVILVCLLLVLAAIMLVQGLHMEKLF